MFVAEDSEIEAAKSVFEFKALDIRENLVDLSAFSGKVCLVVNVASK